MSLLDTVQGSVANATGDHMQQFESKVKEMGMDPKEVMSKIPADKLPEVMQLVKDGKWDELKNMLTHLMGK